MEPGGQSLPDEIVCSERKDDHFFDLIILIYEEKKITTLNKQSISYIRLWHMGNKFDL